MASGDFEITTGGQRLLLMPERAAWWPARQTLIVADLHLGKSQTLRSVGAAIPAGVLDESLARLAAAIERTAAARVLVLGDLLHAGIGLTEGLIDRVEAWRSRVPVPIVVVPGNHDRAIGRVAEVWGLELADECLHEDGLTFRHDPAGQSEPSERATRNGVTRGVAPLTGATRTATTRDGASASDDGTFVWAGHVHPAISLRGGGDRVKLPCFVVGRRLGLLPAFTRFAAGGGDWDPDARVLAICERRVIEIGATAKA